MKIRLPREGENGVNESGNMFVKSKQKLGFSEAVLLMALLLVGGFHEYISCALTIAMSVFLLIRMKRDGGMKIRRDFLTSAVVAVCLGYGLTCFWGVDRGMAVIGFLKFLPLLLYLFCLQQENDTQQIRNVLPVFAAVVAVVSAIGMQFPAVEALFSVADRLAGTFQYPNTFAVLLLVCELLLLAKPGKKIFDYVILAVLVAGLLYTGSRTAFVVAILANVAMLLSMTQKKVRIVSLIVTGGVCLVGLLLAVNPTSVLHRYLTISLTESTFVGRVLYWVDALPLLLKYPFGMGYMGYFYAQQSIQTGVYSVAYIHNDFMQLLLDTGFVPAGLLFTALGIWFFKKSVPTADKIIVGAICVHSFFDFDLQFIGMFMLLLLLLSGDKTDKLLIVKPRLPLKLSFAVAALVCVYIGISLAAAHWGGRAFADAMYPYNTQNKLMLLEQEKDIAKANEMAEQILKQNKIFYAPYSIKAKYYYAQGDFGNVIENQRMALAQNPFNHGEYEAYCKMLIVGIGLYQQAGDSASAEVCRQELLIAAKQLSENTQRLSKLGKMIHDQPNTVLSRELQDYVSKLEGDR